MEVPMDTSGCQLPQPRGKANICCVCSSELCTDGYQMLGIILLTRSSIAP